MIDRQAKTVDVRKMCADINADLPLDVRILALKRVGKSFDMRHDACSRVYNYIAPIKLFYTKKQLDDNVILNEMEHQ